METRKFEVTSQDVGKGRTAYSLTGTFNGETFEGQVVIAASKVTYTYASMTTLTNGHEVLSFHKSAAAAAKGNPQIARKYQVSVRVTPIA